MDRSLVVGAAAAAVAVAAAACSQQVPERAAPPSPPATKPAPPSPSPTPPAKPSKHSSSAPVSAVGSWRLESGTLRGESLPMVPGYRITLTVRGKRASGTAACNRYGGRFVVEGESLTLRHFSMTERGCLPEVIASQEAFVSAFFSADAVARNGRTLILSGPDVRLVFVPRGTVSAEALDGTLWHLKSLITGEGRTKVRGEPATLSLGPDGRILATTGCRALRGMYVIEGDELQVTSMSARRFCPPDLADQSGHVENVLGDTFRVTRDGNRLTVMSMGNRGLIYRSS